MEYFQEITNNRLKENGWEDYLPNISSPLMNRLFKKRLSTIVEINSDGTLSLIYEEEDNI